MAAALAEQGDVTWPFRLVKALPGWHRRGWEQAGLSKEQADALVRVDPHADKTNGFFVALFERARAGAPTSGAGAGAGAGAGTGASKPRKRKRKLHRGADSSNVATPQATRVDPAPNTAPGADAEPKLGRAAKRRRRRREKKRAAAATAGVTANAEKASNEEA